MNFVRRGVEAKDVRTLDEVGQAEARYRLQASTRRRTRQSDQGTNGIALVRWKCIFIMFELIV